MPGMQGFIRVIAKKQAHEFFREPVLYVSEISALEFKYQIRL